MYEMAWPWSRDKSESEFESDTHTHTTVLLLFWNMSGTTRVSRYQKSKTRQVKTNLNLLEQEIVSGSGICWAICEVCTSSQTTTPTSHHSVFYRPDALPAAQPTASMHWRQNSNLTHWAHVTVHRFICVYCEHSGVDLIGLKPNP